jgi:hypothetical protein
VAGERWAITLSGRELSSAIAAGKEVIEQEK